MDSSPPALLFEHHQLLVEYAMLLKPDEPLALLLISTHSLFSYKQTTNTWQILYIEEWASKPLHPIQLYNTLYYAVYVSVAVNPRASEYEMNHFVESDIQYHFTSTGGEDIIIRLSNNEQRLVKFNNRIEDPINIQLCQCRSMDR